MNRTQIAKDFYDKHLADPYSKQIETAAFHLLGLQLDSIESKYDNNSGAVGYPSGIRVTPDETVNYVASRLGINDKDPFDGA